MRAKTKFYGGEFFKYLLNMYKIFISKNLCVQKSWFEWVGGKFLTEGITL